ncbi:alpha/beta fold hydrolase [Agromyces sp. CFH 90414]|uniref:Alpha/beta fold hydrolase n=1 Tax=Agromyces agglutinans TaxID=2662258 RepID=A0A6I2F7K6_9MICO|nr:alpha/beta fold hydrolase [Agromyces agglutinans]MRG60254.1 alpha/beta fold hydrolase [Agromyces agglutinans]
MKLVVAISTSLDGVVQSPAGPGEDRSGGFTEGGWLVPYFDEEVGAFIGAAFDTADALLLGRGTFDLLAAHWPKLTAEQDPGSVLMNSLPRFVVGTPSLPIEWAGTTVLDGDAVEAVRELKRRPGRDLLVQGSPGLIQTLLAADLIDELRLAVAPVLLGVGKRLFGAGTVPAGLELVETSSSASGVVLSRYRPAGPVPHGSWMLEDTAANPAADRHTRTGVESLRIPRPDGAVIAAELIGSPGHPLVLLVAGGESSMDWWRPEFCDLLVARGLRVARYDQRGMGETILGPVHARRDGLAVALGDALAVLDAAGVREAHWVGFSAGAWVCQLAALDHAHRVRALTLVSTTPTMGEADADLPGSAAHLHEAWANPPREPDWSDHDAVVEYHVEIDRDYAGDEFDEAHDRAIWADTVRRSPGMHHDEEAGEFEEVPRWRERLGSIDVPTTVVHGTADPMFPIGNGEALARDIPGASLVRVPGLGHELPPSAWPFVVEAVAG